MTIAANDRKVLFQPVVDTTDFPLDFPLFANEDLKVFVNSLETSQYSVTATYVDGQSDDAVVVLNAAANGVNVEIVGSRIPRQENTYPTKGRDLAKNLLRDINSLTATQQEQSRDVAQALEDASASGPLAQAAEAARDDAVAAQLAAEEAQAAAEAAENTLLEFQGDWVTGTAYKIGDLTVYQGSTYHCLIAHTADASFGVDLTAGRWRIFAEADFNRNLNVPVRSTGSATAYAVSLPDPPPALFDGLAGVIKFHVENGFEPTVDIDGRGAIPLQIRDNSDTLNNITPGLFGANEIAPFVVRSGFVAEIISQPLRELVAGRAILPLASQTGNFDSLIEGSHSTVLEGSWVNGPLGATAQDYGAVNGVAAIIQLDEFVIQTVHMEVSGDLQEFRRKGSGVPLSWSAWEKTAAGVGAEQSWVDVSASRTNATAYQNTSSRPIMVSIAQNHTSLVQVSEDGVSNWVDVGRTAGQTTITVNFIVPPGHWYRVETAGGIVFVWAELK